MTLSASPAARSRARRRWHALADRLRTVRPEALAKGAHRARARRVSVQLVDRRPGRRCCRSSSARCSPTRSSRSPTGSTRSCPAGSPRSSRSSSRVALLVGVVVVVVPPLLNGLIVRRRQAPAHRTRCRRGWRRLQPRSAPSPSRCARSRSTLMDQVAANLRATMQAVVRARRRRSSTSQILGIFGTADQRPRAARDPGLDPHRWSSDERTIKQRGARLFPEAVRADVAALFRIVDRALATFLRVRVLLAVVDRRSWSGRA